MRTLVLASILSMGLVAVVSAGDTPKSQEQSQSETAKAKSSMVTVTGVVDEVGGDYFLTNAQDFTPIAKLEGNGLKKEVFARFVGMPVSVHGTMMTGADGTQKILKIAKMGDIRDLPRPATTE